MVARTISMSDVFVKFLLQHVPKWWQNPGKPLVRAGLQVADGLDCACLYPIRAGTRRHLLFLAFLYFLREVTAAKRCKSHVLMMLSKNLLLGPLLPVLSCVGCECWGRLFFLPLPQALRHITWPITSSPSVMTCVEGKRYCWDGRFSGRILVLPWSPEKRSWKRGLWHLLLVISPQVHTTRTHTLIYYLGRKFRDRYLPKMSL